MKKEFSATIDKNGVHFFTITERGTEMYLTTYPAFYPDGVRTVSTAAIRFVNDMVNDGWCFLPLEDEKPEGEA